MSLPAELRKGKKVIGRIMIPMKFTDVEFMTYVEGLFGLARVNHYIRKCLNAEEALEFRAKDIGVDYDHMLNIAEHQPDVAFSYVEDKDGDKPKKVRTSTHEAFKSLYRKDKHTSMVTEFVRDFYGTTDELIGLVPSGDIEKDIYEDHKGFGSDQKNGMVELTTAELFRRACNLMYGYQPRIRKKGKDCSFKFQGRKYKIPIIYVQKVLEKKRLPDILTQQVLTALKIEYRMNRDLKSIVDPEAYIMDKNGNVLEPKAKGYKKQAEIEFIKCLKKICLFIEDKQDPMPFEDKEFDEWLDNRLVKFSGHDDNERIGPGLDMTVALDALFFLSRIGQL